MNTRSEKDAKESAPDHARLRPQVVDGDLEEALDLARVKIHRDDVVAASDLEHVGNEFGRDGRPRLLFPVLREMRIRSPSARRTVGCGNAHHASVGEAGDDGRDPPRACRLAGRDKDEELHQEVVRVVEGFGMPQARRRARRPRAVGGSRRGSFRRVLETVVVRGAKGVGGRVEAGLEDEDVLVADRLADLDRGFVVAELLDGAAAELDP